MMNKILKIKCGFHKIELIEEKYTEGNTETIDWVCPKCIEELNNLKTTYNKDYTN